MQGGHNCFLLVMTDDDEYIGLSGRPIRSSTRNSSGDEIANVNFFMTTSSTNYMQCAPEATEFGEIT